MFNKLNCKHESRKSKCHDRCVKFFALCDFSHQSAGASVTVEDVKTEMRIILAIKKTDVREARERWKSLKERVDRHIAHYKLPEIWAKVLKDELTKSE